MVSLRVGGVERAERRQPVAIEGSADRLTAPLALDGGEGRLRVGSPPHSATVAKTISLD